MEEAFYLQAIVSDEGIIHKIPDEIKTIAFYEKAIKKNWRVYEILSSKLKESRYLSFVAVNENGLNYRHIPEHFKETEAFIGAMMSNDGLMYRYLPQKYKDQRQNALLAVIRDGTALQFMPDAFKNDIGIIFAALNSNPDAIVFLPNGWQRQFRIFRMALYKDGMNLMLGDEFCYNKQLVMIAVKQNGLALRYASPCLRNNKEVVLAAIKNNGEALQYASEEIKFLIHEQRSNPVDVLQKYVQNPYKHQPKPFVFRRVKN